MSTEPEHKPDSTYDVVVIGGAFSGASSALLLRRLLPSCRVLIVEKSPVFDRKVGEATVEVSSLFLHRVLGLYDELSRNHLPKHGLRFWFTDKPDRRLGEMGEIGPAEAPRLPSFQLDRARLDERLLALAEEEGCTVLRPAQVLAIELGWPASRLQIADADGLERTVTARWVIDASGRRAVLSRQLGLQQHVPEHPTAAAWARWRGVADLDGPRVMGGDPRVSALPRISAARRLGTNHFCGYGWWCWVIPLAGGETSIGVVYNKELFSLPGDGPPKERYRAFISQQPGLRELLDGAEMDEDDFRAYAHLPYKSSRYADHGWALVGDAASFIDPFYSPGLDHASISIYATVRLIEDELAGRLDEAALGERVAAHNDQFSRSYDRWIAALYLGKYEVMGDAELMSATFLVDTAGYYLGVVTPIHRDIEVMRNPVYGAPVPQAKIAFQVMRAFNQRMLTLARARRQVGSYARHNSGWRVFPPTFALGRGSLKPLWMGLKIWLRLEREHFFSRLRHGSLDVSQPVAIAAKAPTK